MMDGLLLTACLFWGMSFVWSKQVTDLGMGPNAYLAIRYLAGAAILLPLFAKGLRGSQKRDLLLAVLIGVLVYLGMVAQMVGMRYTTAANSAFITAAYVALVPFVCWLMFRQRPNGRSLLAVALCLGGLYALNMGPDGLTFNRGNLITIICALCWSVQVPLMSYAGRTARTELLAIVPMATTGMLSLVTGLVRNEFTAAAAHFRPLLWPVLLSVLLPTLLSNTIQAYAQKHVPPTRAAIIYTTESMFACLLSVAMGMEKLTPQLALGGGLILGGVLLSELPVKRRFKE